MENLNVAFGQNVRPTCHLKCYEQNKYLPAVYHGILVRFHLLTNYAMECKKAFDITRNVMVRPG